MSNEIADAIIQQCKDFINDPENNFLITYFNEKLASFPGLTADEQTLLKEQNYSAVMKSVIPAYESLIDTLTHLKNTSTNKIGLCGFVGGKEYYQ